VVRGLSSLALVAVVCCGGTHIVLPAEFADDMDRLAAEGDWGAAAGGDEEAFEIGPYKIDGVTRGLTISEGFDKFENFEPAPKGAYRYSFAGGGAKKLAGKCAVRAPKETKRLDGTVIAERELSLACTCERGGDIVARVFVEDLAGEYGGPLVVRDVEAQATGVYKLDNGEQLKDRPAGYRIEDASGPVAAAEVLPGAGHVWIKRGLEEPGRREMMCVLAGLMLWIWPEQQKD
jgi:hypothetical protein